MGKAGGKTRKIRPSSSDLCSFRYVAGRSVQDCGKVVQKLAGREDEKYKLCTTLCAPLRHGTRIVQVSFPRCVRCVGVVVRRCAIRSFSLPPAEAGCPFRRRGRGGRQTEAGRTHGRGGLLCEGASAFAFALPHPAHGGAGHGATTAWTLFQSDAYTPREQPTGERYLYIRVRRREGENVLHRPAGNDVDNFSVDNPLWITAAAGGRLLRGGSGRLCGGSVNADGAGAKAFAGDGYSQGASFGPMVAISRRGQGGRIYNNTRTRERLRRKCVKPADLTTHSPPKTVTRPRTATRPARAFSHSLPAHFRPPTQPKRTPAGCAMHSSPTSPPIPRRRPAPAPAQRHALPEHFRSPTQHRRTPADLTTHSPPKTCSRPRTATRPARAFSHPRPATMHARRPHNTFPVEDLLPPPHSDAHCPSTFAPPRSADARPPTSPPIPHRRPSPAPSAPPCLPLRSASGTKKRHRTVDVRCRMSRSTVVAVGHWGW